MKESRPWDGFLPTSAASEVEVDALAFRGKRVLITGGGGFIGSALARVIQTCSPGQLVLLDHAEQGLYLVERDIEKSDRAQNMQLVVGSVCDPLLVREVFETYRPQLIFHAAALKHVPLMEANLLAAIETNVLGMEIIAKAAAEYSAEKLVLLSTDKAVDPISIMGLSKRMAELIVLGNCSETAMTAMRLCNVLGSSGSVAPHFVRQIERGEAVTVTHPDATRYFLSIDNAVRLLLFAATRDAKTELVIPKLDLPEKIVDLAKFLIKRIGQHRSHILFTHLRPGDKLHENMYSMRERVHPAESEEALLAVEGPSLTAARLEEVLLTLRDSIRRRNRSSILEAVTHAVPEYMPGMETASR